jgi:hypothetical protein
MRQAADSQGVPALSTRTVDKSVEGHGAGTAQPRCIAGWTRLGDFLVKLKYAFSINDLPRETRLDAAGLPT